MSTEQQQILRSARIAELRVTTANVAALCKQPAAVELPADNRDGRRVLLQLLARERRRNAKLVEQLFAET
jgi:hypothetical protein